MDEKGWRDGSHSSIRRNMQGKEKLEAKQDEDGWDRAEVEKEEKT